MAVHITGDIHGESGRFCEECMPGESSWGKDDILIACGDFGIIWHNTSNKMGKARDDEILDKLESKPYMILFCVGNHENFNELYSYPIVEIFGGRAHEIRDNIYHLMRGEIFNIQGNTYFVMGGAYSIEKEWRHEGETWWPQELPNSEEYKNAGKHLKNADFKVDYIISHTCPTEIIKIMLGAYPNVNDMELIGFLNQCL